MSRFNRPAGCRLAVTLLAAALASPPARASGELEDLQALRAQAARFLAEHAPADGAELAIEVSPPDARLRLTACREPVEAFPGPGGRLLGRVSVGLRCTSPAWKLYLPATVAANRPVVVASRPLRRGELLGRDDVELASVDVSSLSSGFETQLQAVIGRTLLTPLAAGRPLTPRALSDPSAVERGESIDLVVRIGAAEVVSSGIALHEARAGEPLRARNAASGREVRGRLDEHRRLIIE